MGGKTVITAVLLISVIASFTIHMSSANVDAQGGYITKIDISGDSNTNYWQGYYGVMTTENSPIYKSSFNVSSPATSRIRKLELGATIRDGDYLLITSSPVPFSISQLKPGDISKVNLITGSGSDSGTNTFTFVSTYSIPGSGITLSNVPTTYAYVNSSPQFENFKEGLLEDDKGNLVFVVPINLATDTGYDGGKYSFQFIVPNNFTNPLTYYMYYVPNLITDENRRRMVRSFDVVSIQYNEISKQLEVTFCNNGTFGVYFKSHINVLADGVIIATIDDEVIQYILAGQELVITYYIDLTNYTSTSNITVQISNEYGLTPIYINEILAKEFDISINPAQAKSTIESVDLDHNDQEKDRTALKDYSVLSVIILLLTIIGYLLWRK